MADTKITDLAALGAAPASGDLFVVVDVSDSTMDAAGTDKKITATNAFSGLATSAQGALADTAVQPADLASGSITPESGDLDLTLVATALQPGDQALVVAALDSTSDLVAGQASQHLVSDGTITLTIQAEASTPGYPDNMETFIRVNTNTLTIASENVGGAPLINGATTSLVAPAGSTVHIKREGVDEFIVLIDQREVSKSVSVEDPTSSEDITLFRADQAYTITKMVAVVIGSSPSLTWTVRKHSDRSNAGVEVVTSGTTTTNTTTGAVVTSLNSAGIAADDFVWLESTAESGTTDEFHLTIFMSPV